MTILVKLQRAWRNAAVQCRRITLQCSADLCSSNQEASSDVSRSGTAHYAGSEGPRSCAAGYFCIAAGIGLGVSEDIGSIPSCERPLLRSCFCSHAPVIGVSMMAEAPALRQHEHAPNPKPCCAGEDAAGGSAGAECSNQHGAACSAPALAAAGPGLRAAGRLTLPGTLCRAAAVRQAAADQAGAHGGVHGGSPGDPEVQPQPSGPSRGDFSPRTPPSTCPGACSHVRDRRLCSAILVRRHASPPPGILMSVPGSLPNRLESRLDLLPRHRSCDRDSHLQAPGS